MRNIPKAVFLQIGEFHSIVDDFNELDEVTWSTESVDRDDAEYIRRDIHRKEVTKAYYEGAAEATEHLFTKEQVIELMKEAYEDGVSEGVNFYPEGSSIPSKKVMSYNEWLINLKPFDPK